MVFAKLIVSTAGTLLAYSLFRLIRLFTKQLTSPVRDLPGPKSSHWFYGSVKEFLKDASRIAKFE
jgi:hypothetical protein